MNEQLYQDWINALRSGDYEPARNKLRHGNRFCCLGVVCDLYPFGYWSSNSNYINSDIASDIYLPPNIQETLNIRTRTGEFDFTELSQPLQEHILTELHARSTNLGTTYSLVALNDVLDFDTVFPIIADILEEAPPSLFSVN